MKHYHTCITYTIGTSRFLTKLRILESKNKLALVHKPPLLQPPPLFDVCAWNDEEEWVVDEKLAMSFELSNWMKDYAYDLKATTYLISYSWKNALSIVPTYYIVLWRSSKILTEQEYLPIYRGSSHKTVKQGTYYYDKTAICAYAMWWYLYYKIAVIWEEFDSFYSIIKNRLCSKNVLCMDILCGDPLTEIYWHWLQ